MRAHRAGPRPISAAVLLALSGFLVGCVTVQPGEPTSPTDRRDAGEASMSTLPVVVSPAPTTAGAAATQVIPPTQGTLGPTPAERDAPGADPADLPRLSGSVRTGSSSGHADGLDLVTITYRTTATIDAARAHYRRMLRAHDWRLVEIEFEDGVWEIDASRGRREVELELWRRGDRTLIRVAISDPG